MKVAELSTLYPTVVADFWEYCFRNPNGLVAWEYQTGRTVDDLLLAKLRSYHSTCGELDMLSLYKEKKEHLSFLLTERRLKRKAICEPYDGVYRCPYGLNITFKEMISRFNKLSYREQKENLRFLDRQIQEVLGHCA